MVFPESKVELVGGVIGDCEKFPVVLGAGGSELPEGAVVDVGQEDCREGKQGRVWL